MAEEYSQELIDKLKMQLLQEIQEGKIKLDEEVRKGKLDQMQDKLESYSSDMKNSDIPWVTVTGIVHDPEYGIRVDMDWNEAYIDFLKKSGFVGATDDDIAQMYLAYLLRDIIEQDIASPEEKNDVED
jgi:hypothetical protein